MHASSRLGAWGLNASGLGAYGMEDRTGTSPLSLPLQYHQVRFILRNNRKRRNLSSPLSGLVGPPFELYRFQHSGSPPKRPQTSVSDLWVEGLKFRAWGS